jgi:S-adenosylmethionine/arginine decarboxylase-like enzyme
MKQHKHVIIRAKVKEPISDPFYANTFLADLIKRIKMEVLVPPQSVYCYDEGNEGITAFTIITTSHIALHIWDKDGIAQLDVYSCKNFDPNVVYDLLDAYMGVLTVSSALVLRDDEVTTEKLVFRT